MSWFSDLFSGGRVRRLERQLEESRTAVSTLEYRVWVLERKGAELTEEKGKLVRQLEDARKAGLVFMDAADMYQEVTEKQIRAKAEELEGTRKASLLFMDAADMYQEAVERQIKEKVEDLEDTRNACVVFMDAADVYQEVTEKQIREKVEELEDTREAGMVFINAADMYQEVAEKQLKVKMEELEDMRKAALVFMDAADRYQEAADNKIKEKEEELKVIWTEKAEMHASAEYLKSELKAALAKNQELEADSMVKKGGYDLVKEENGTLRSKVLTIEQKHSLSELEVEKFKMEFDVLAEAKEVAAYTFGVEMEEIIKESEDITSKVEQIQSSKDLVKNGNDKLLSNVLALLEHKQSLSEAEVKKLKKELGTLAEAKEAAIKLLDAEKAGMMKELEDLKRKVEEIQASKGENGNFMEGQKYSWSEPEVKRHNIELVAKAKEVVAIAFDVKKAEIMTELDDLKRKEEEIQAIKDLVKNKNDRLRLEVLTVEQKHSLNEVEVERLDMELGDLPEVKKVSVRTFDAEKADNMEETEDLKRNVVEIQASKEVSNEKCGIWGYKFAFFLATPRLSSCITE